MDLEKEYEELVEYFGKDNLQFEYFNDDEIDIDNMNPDDLLKRLFSQVKLTHLPTGKEVLGTSEKYQIENAISALRELKSSLT